MHELWFVAYALSGNIGWDFETIAALLAGCCWYLLLRILKTVWNDFCRWACLKWAKGMLLTAWFAVWEFCPLPCCWLFCVSVRLNTILWALWRVQKQSFHFNLTEQHEAAVQYILKHFRGGGLVKLIPLVNINNIGLLPCHIHRGVEFRNIDRGKIVLHAAFQIHT